MQCLEEENIEKAIRVVYLHEGVKTAGKDGISKRLPISQRKESSRKSNCASDDTNLYNRVKCRYQKRTGNFANSL